MNFYDFNNDPSTIKQETLISSIIEGRNVPRDLSNIEDLASITPAGYLFVSEGGDAYKIALTDITTGAVQVVDTLPESANEGQLAILKLAQGQYEFHRYTKGKWDALHIASDADIVTYDSEDSSLHSTTVQTALDEIASVLDNIKAGSVYSVNGQVGDLTIDGTEGKIQVSAEDQNIFLDASTLALDADLAAETERAEAAEEAAELAAKAYAKDYTDQEVAALSEDVYHKEVIKEIALTGEAKDVTVENFVTTDNLQVALDILNQKQHTGGFALRVARLDVPEAGNLVSYQLRVEDSEGTIVPGLINIPKDYMLKGGELNKCEVADTPLEGFKVGDPYIQLNIGTADAATTLFSYYINLAELVYHAAENASKIQLSIDRDSEGQHIISASVVSGSIARTDLVAGVQTELDQIETNRQAIVKKVDKKKGFDLFSDAEKTKLAGIEAGAEVNVQADWLQSDGTADSYILNKPNLAPVALSGQYGDLEGLPLAGEGIDISTDSEGNLIITNTNISAEWGNILGDLDDQEDLKEALAGKVDVETDASLMTSAEHSKLENIEAGAQVNFINSVDSNHFDVQNRQLQLRAVQPSEVVGLGDLLDAKVDKISDHSLVADSEITKLAGVSVGATKTEFAAANGALTIDGVTEAVYTAPIGTVVDPSYAHITVTDSSVTDGTNTLTKYDDTLLAGRVTEVEGDVATLQSDKQSNLTSDQLTATNSGITSQKVGAYDTHLADSAIHVTAAQKTAWTGKQDALNSENKLSTDYVEGLAAVATSGEYSDLLHTPTIPVVNDATLTIQKNGVSLGTFSANASEGVTVNVTVPTNTSELINGANFATTGAVEAASAAIETKLDKQVLTDVSFAVNGQQATLQVTKDKYNLGTQQATTTTVSAVAIADENNAGLMSSYSVKSLADLQSRVSSLEGSNIRLLYDVTATGHTTDPTYTQINSFVTGLGYETPFQGVTITISDTMHVWRYYVNMSDRDSEGHWIDTPVAWRDDGVEAVSIFTNTTPGTILGAGTSDGQIYAEDNGTGSVVGWDTVKARIANLETNGGNWDEDTTIKTRLAEAVGDIESLETSKQDALVSGINIKSLTGADQTVYSLVGEGTVALTKGVVGLGNVANTGDSATPVAGGTTKFTTGGAYTELAKKQDALVSGTNIKTVNGTTLLGSGNVGVGVTSITLSVEDPLGISGSGAITSTGTRTITHDRVLAEAGGTAGTYGNNTQSATLTYGGSFKVPVVGADAYGHVNAIGEYTLTLPASDNTNTTYTFAGGTNSFTVTPSGGTAQTVTVTPSITNNITGTGTSGKLVVFNGANTIADGPAINSSGSANKFLNERGSWVQISEATQSAAGLMSATDKAKVDNTITASNTLKISKISAPTASGGSTYSNGTAGQVLKTNGTNMYWAADNDTTYTAGRGLELYNNTTFRSTYTYTDLEAVTTAGWTAANNIYSQTISVAGVTANSHPVVDLRAGSSGALPSAVKNKVIAWSKVFYATAGDNTITLYAYERPTTAFGLLVYGY